ncbi:MAG: hypothetical protein LAP86_11540 [Acidobacteriia bacterium]|nr:hypothetical protein [Terriglobia bacterium]
MLQAHSFLWNYLWVAPNLLLLAVGFLIWKRGISREVPAFLAFTILGALGDLAVFGADVAPFISAENYWRIEWARLLIESLLKFLVIGEIFSRVFTRYPSISRVSRIAVSVFGAVLVLMAGLIAGFAHGDSTRLLISGDHLLEQTVFVIESGLILFLFLFAAYFRLSWDRLSFGILLGFGISSCVHLSAWAIIANASPSERARTLFAFLNMGTYHLCVLMWLYYVLVPQKVVRKSVVPLPENNLAVWNRELERLLQQ